MRVTTLGLAAMAAVLAAGSLLSAEEKTAPKPAAAAAGKADVAKAVAVLHPTKDSTVEGTVTFEQAGHEVHVRGHLSGLTPGNHGFHIHEFGDCSAPDGTSAGGHFNPTGAPHAGPHDAKRHVGDLGNIEAGADGTVTIDAVDHGVALEGTAGIVGRGVIVHAKADDMKTQPTGDAGGRIACGVVGVAKP